MTSIMSRRTSNAQALPDGRIKFNFHNVHDRFYSEQRRTDRSIKRKHAHITFGARREVYDRLQPLKGVPRMNICILITGSRGDVQPFIALGQKLQAEPYNHRVRIGTHPVFREFVRDNGLDFFSIGGDPSLLMAYMVRNPGILPSLESIRAGDVGARKADLEGMLMGAWKACTEACDDYDLAEGGDVMHTRPFVADAIISNPPTYASLHIAERLAIPLHMMFTMPWSPTTAFPHPLAQMDSSRTNTERRNYMSYMQIELLSWLGLADIINRFRRRTLLLEPIDPTWGTNLMARLKVPYTYCWSPTLIPKPTDWKNHIGISGFFFLPKALTYKPDPGLQAFIDDGEPPVYIGFGSIVVDHPESFTQLILDAVHKAGVRALVSKGWSNVGGADVPENVFLLGNVPHDWLFQHVSAVVHHGGAGTCAIGLVLGRPTVIVPFFGDQFWWAGIVSRAGAGPPAVPYKKLTADNLAKNIRLALEPGMRMKAQEFSEKMKGENGVKVAVEQFHAMLPLPTSACFLCPDRVAVWRIKGTNIKLSAFAVAVLGRHKKISPHKVKLIRHKRWYVEEGAPDPLLGAGAAVIDAISACISDIQDCKRSIVQAAKTTSTVKIDMGPTSKSEEVNHSVGRPIARLARELAVETATCPVNFFYQIANGFHNMPSVLFHDQSVRVRDNIVGLRSGLKVVSKEVVFGVYDGITGLVAQPYHGFKDGQNRKGGAALGALKGTGRGLHGLVCRAGAIAFGIPGYTMKGVEMQFRHSGSNMDQITDLPKIVIQEPGRSGNIAHQRALWEEWAKIAAGFPILQRRIWQALADIHEADETDPEQESAVLERWAALISQHR